MILYSNGGTFTRDELMILRVLNDLGVDIVMAEPMGDQAYLKHDPQGQYSQLMMGGDQPFPKDFTLKQLRKEMQAVQPVRQPVAPVQQNSGAAFQPRQTASQQPKPAAVPPQRFSIAPPRPLRQQEPPHKSPQQQPAAINLDSRIPRPQRTNCINAWMKEAAYTQILQPVVSRSDDRSVYCHALIRQTGVNDRITYENELYTFHQQLKATGRTILLLEDGIPDASPE